MDKNSYIINIKRKLINNEPLTSVELQSVITALRESGKCFQKPYYEVIYHDEVDNTETRIMDPVYSSRKSFNEDHDIRDDYFELHFDHNICINHSCNVRCPAYKFWNREFEKKPDKKEEEHAGQ